MNLKDSLQTKLCCDNHFVFLFSPVDLCFLSEQARAGIDYESSYGKVRANDTILKLQRTTPYYKRNRAHVCSFYIRGQCTRGLECPYRHEMPETGELSQQNIKDRYYGYVQLNLYPVNLNGFCFLKSHMIILTFNLLVSNFQYLLAVYSIFLLLAHTFF